MTYERFEELIDTTPCDYDIPNKELEGFNIMAKYSNGENVFGGADHDVIYGAAIETLIENGITEEDVIRLGECTFNIEDGEYLQTYV